MLAVVFLFLLVMPPSRAQLSIISTSPESGAILPAGASSTTLTCTATSPWYLCIWEGPGGLACQCQSPGGGGVNAVCQGYPRVTLFGGGNACSATISGLAAEDAGDYRCILMDARQFSPVSRTISLEVGRPAVVAWAMMTAGRSSYVQGWKFLVVVVVKSCVKK